MIAAYCSGFGMQSSIFRFVSVLGERYTHGHIVDFCRQLRDDPHKLRVLGNGGNESPTCTCKIASMRCCFAVAKSTEQVAIFNLGTDAIAKSTSRSNGFAKRSVCKPSLEFSGGERGWTGDNPFIFSRHR